ncbi:hypothetical protein BGZ95_008932 [Linnemannia exigua]|uniref:Uncharacterized protein n=1 Tax=Linnemannia exigua TaxID=604196 RepID=A0AAD4DDN2_9FUNG|nr:hypothetical protein BGZ95_008932 [Linnemannia exigua]
MVAFLGRIIRAESSLNNSDDCHGGACMVPSIYRGSPLLLLDLVVQTSELLPLLVDSGAVVTITGLSTAATATGFGSTVAATGFGTGTVATGLGATLVPNAPLNPARLGAVSTSLILKAARALTTIVLRSASGRNRFSHGTVKDIFLNHALTLECLEVQGNRSPETLQALLRSSPSHRAVKTMESNFGERPSMEVKLDVVGATAVPWDCTLIENLEGRITSVSRLDIVNTLIEDTDNWIPDPATQDPPQPAALQESHTFQRMMLRQLGRLTHQRKLCLGAIVCDWDYPGYSQLQIQGIWIMVVDEYIQRSCLEPDELA